LVKRALQSCRSTNDLLRQEAVLTESAVDIVDALSSQALKYRSPDRPPELPQTYERKEEMEPVSAHEKIIELLGATPTGVDELVRECHMSAAAVQSTLLELKLAGRIERHPGNRISVIL